jgi:hypothetical protein
MERSGAEVEEEVPTLEYATPVERPPRRWGRLVIGIVAALSLGFGAGLTTFGAMVESEVRDEVAAVTGTGVGCLVFGAVVMFMYVTRR